MGLFSWNCKHCGHPALYQGDKGINDWMTSVVVLSPNGSRHIGEYDGYGRVINAASSGYDESEMSDGCVLVHLACWEVAGKPEFGAYDGPSESADDQGYFFDDEHDMIDPRVTDPVERERRLLEGRHGRAESRQRRRDEEAYHILCLPTDRDEAPWRRRRRYPGRSTFLNRRDVYGVRDLVTQLFVYEAPGPVEALPTEDLDPAEWEAKREVVREAQRESRRCAEAEACRLNAQWEAEGLPVTEDTVHAALDSAEAFALAAKDTE